MADAKKITALLLKKYPNPKISLNFSNPLELLVATILSARCTDVKVNEVTNTLFIKYKTAKDFADADISTFEQEIRQTGFFRNKAKMTIECCNKIIHDFNGKVPESIEELTTLSGVGRKTANVVLGGAFGKQTMAVDTHVIRVSNRLGLVASTNPDVIEQSLLQQVHTGKLNAFNMALILHGRETCIASKPKCPACVLYGQCEWPDKPVAPN